jgi:cyclic-di-GMP phosphodiesterase TipF (flagellum assembly factor)
MVTPEQYMAVAEEAGLVAAIDNLLLFRYIQLVRRARRDHMKRLAGCGFRFSLDRVVDLNLDLPRLAAQGFKFIKINAHLLHEMARGEDPELDMRRLKGALDRVAMDLIVEKIETEDMLLDLLDLNIDYGQGYYLGEPRRASGAG